MSDKGNKNLCLSCAHSIFCNTWGQFKCTADSVYVYKNVTECENYKKRPAGFKEKNCQCEDCLTNEVKEET